MGSSLQHTLYLGNMSVVNVRVRNNVNEFAYFQIRYLREHMHKYGILNYVPVVCYRHIVRALIENSVQLAVRNVECNRISARIQIHFVQIPMNVNVGYNPSACRVIFQIV